MTRGTVARRPRRRAGLGLLVLFIISVGLLLVPLASTGVLAASVEPVTSLEDARLAGNPTCSEIAAWHGGGQTWTGAKIESQPELGTYGFGATGSVTITAWDPATMTFSWTSTFGVDAVLIKAGQGGEDAANTLYVYSPAADSPESFGDIGLASLGARGISHVDFCWDPGAPPSPSPSPEASVQPSEVPASPSPSPSPGVSPSPASSVGPSQAPASASPGPSASPSPEAGVGPAASFEVSPSPTGEVLAAVDTADVTPPPTDLGLDIGLPAPPVAGVGLLLAALSGLGWLAVAAARRSRRTS